MCGIGRVSSSIELVLFSCIRPFSLIVLGIYDSGFVQVYVEICWYMHDIVEYDIMFSACIKYSIVIYDDTHNHHCNYCLSVFIYTFFQYV